MRDRFSSWKRINYFRWNSLKPEHATDFSSVTWKPFGSLLLSLSSHANSPRNSIPFVRNNLSTSGSDLSPTFRHFFVVCELSSSFKINKETRTIPVYRQTSPFTDYSHILRISHSRLLSRHRRMTSKSTCFLVKSKDRREIRLIYKYKNGIKFPRKSTLGYQCDISYAIIPRSKHSVG